MIEGFNNPNWMMQADRVLKEIGKEKAQEYYKVGFFFFFGVNLITGWFVMQNLYVASTFFSDYGWMNCHGWILSLCRTEN